MAAWHQGGKEVPILKFLVAGGAGFIGSNLCGTLVNRGDEVVCIDNLVTGRLENIASLLALPNFTFVEHDLVDGVPAIGPLDAVLNLASPASPVGYKRHS